MEETVASLQQLVRDLERKIDHLEDLNKELSERLEKAASVLGGAT